MVAQVAALAAEGQPLLERFARFSSRRLAGRTAVLSTVFGGLIVTASWFGADPLPLSHWQRLGLDVESAGLRRVHAQDAESLTDLFAAHDYYLAALRNDANTGVPRLAVSALPRDMDDIADSDARKKLFLRTVLPLVIEANRELLRARAQVIAALDARAEGRLGSTDALWLDSLAEWYGAAPGDVADLLSRIDAVPPSLVLAQAAQESGWGTSRFALRGNALFGQRSWGGVDEGLAPKRADRKDFKVRAFPDLMSALRSYLHNLNSHRAYQNLRDRRARARALGTPLDSLDMIAGLKNYSEEGAAYVAALSELIRGNDLQALDRLALQNAP
jgi:Bax protein